MKKETLEEAAEKFIKKQEYDSLEIDDKIFEAILFGAKWQQERMYSEEDMWEAYKASNTIFEDKIALRQEFEKWFEQFKKK